MRLTYDPAANVAYISLRERQGDVETIEVTADVLLDIDETGQVCGIELLDAREQLKGDGGRFVLVNRESGDERELDVA
jgi:uncharacterized protein YuzE